YPDDYNLIDGPNEENSSVSSDKYSTHFSDRWIKDEYKDKVSTSNGEDFLDRNQNFYSPGDCARTEKSFSLAEGCFLTNKDGAVRSIRAYMGANSGKLVQRTHYFYEGREDILTDMRVHSISSMYDIFDYDSNAIGMTY